MNIITHEVKIDLTLPCANDRVYTFKDDFGTREIKFILTQNKMPYNIPIGARINFLGCMDDKNVIFSDCSYNGNIVVMPITRSMTHSGATVGYLSIILENGNTVTTPPVTIININENSVEDEILALHDLNSLINAIIKAEGAKIRLIDINEGQLRIVYNDGSISTIDLKDLSLVGIEKIEKSEHLIDGRHATQIKFTMTDSTEFSFYIPSGENGKDGKDGTSVTVSNVTTSSADGGSNVVTFSDGKTVTIKNGSKGSKGDTGDKGDKGDQGIQGIQGAKGDKGDKGDTGATGATGAAGKDGADGATAEQVIAAMSKETWTFTLEDGSTVQKVVPLI